MICVNNTSYHEIKLSRRFSVIYVDQQVYFKYILGIALWRKCACVSPYFVEGPSRESENYSTKGRATKQNNDALKTDIE